MSYNDEDSRRRQRDEEDRRRRQRDEEDRRRRQRDWDNNLLNPANPIGLTNPLSPLSIFN
jgi:hypothetical protein